MPRFYYAKMNELGECVAMGSLARDPKISGVELAVKGEHELGAIRKKDKKWYTVEVDVNGVETGKLKAKSEKATVDKNKFENMTVSTAK